MTETEQPPDIELPWRKIHCYRHGHDYQGDFSMACLYCGKRRNVVPSPLVVIGVVVFGVAYVKLYKFKQWLSEAVA